MRGLFLLAYRRMAVDAGTCHSDDSGRSGGRDSQAEGRRRFLQIDVREISFKVVSDYRCPAEEPDGGICCISEERK